VPHPKVKISDDAGNTVAVDTSSNALHVKLAESIDVGMLGDVNIKLDGTNVSAGADDIDTGTIRVTLASNDTQFGEIGDDAAVAGNIHGQLRYIGNALGSQSTIASNTGGAKDALNWAVSTTGGQYAEGDGGFLATGVRNDTLASLVSYDHDHAPFQVNTDGALYVEVASSATLTVNSHAVTNAGTFAVQTDATVHPAGNGTFNSYAQFTAATTPTALTDATNGVNGTETAAKEVIIQADFDNSEYIMVGDNGAAADTNGIRLNAGDTIILPVANIADIYIDASTSSQTVNVTVIK